MKSTQESRSTEPRRSRHLRPGWTGNLLVAVLVRQMLNRSVLDGERVMPDEVLLKGIGRVRAATVAPDGYIYPLTEAPGMLVRLVPVDQPRLSIRRPR